VIEDSEELFSSTDHVDALELARDYQLHLIFYSFTLFTLFLRIVIIARINRNIHIILKTVEIAAKNVGLYMIFLCPILLGIVIISISLWGTDFVEFSDFGHALTTNLLFTVGHGNIMELIEANYSWGVVYFIMYFFIVVFFLLSVFMGIYMDAYRLIRLREGYEDNYSLWTLKDYLLWVCACIPRKLVQVLTLQ
jgi:hypothetical protein